MSEDKTNDGAKSASSNPASPTPAAKPASSSNVSSANKSAGASPGKSTSTTQSDASGGGTKTSSASQSSPAGSKTAAAGSASSASKPASASSASPAAGSRPGQSTGSTASKAGSARPANANRAPSSGGGAGGGKTGQAKGGSSAALLVAAVALILALLAAAGAGWLWYRGQAQMADMNSRVNTVEQGMQSNVQQVVMPRLSEVDNKTASLSSDVRGLSNQMDQRQQQIDQLQEQIRNVQTQNSQLVDRLDGTHQRYIAQRVEALLEAANQRLTIYNDPKGAAQALQLADSAIQQAGDPRLFPVRRDIANSQAAIKALPNPDIEGLSLKLSNLVAQVPTLPLATNVPSDYRDNQSGSGQSDSSNDDSGFSSIDVSRGWHHFTSSLGTALSSMVTIRRANGTQDAPALMAPDQAYFLTQNLQLQLRSAELALMNRNGDAYRDNLSSARDWIKQYFNGDESSVQAALDTLNELSNVQLDWQAPDISAGMQTLNNVMSSQGGQNSQDSAASSPASADSADAVDGGSEQ